MPKREANLEVMRLVCEIGQLHSLHIIDLYAFNQYWPDKSACHPPTLLWPVHLVKPTTVYSMPKPICHLLFSRICSLVLDVHWKRLRIWAPQILF